MEFIRVFLNGILLEEYNDASWYISGDSLVLNLNYNCRRNNPEPDMYPGYFKYGDTIQIDVYDNGKMIKHGNFHIVPSYPDQVGETNYSGQQWVPLTTVYYPEDDFAPEPEPELDPLPEIKEDMTPKAEEILMAALEVLRESGNQEKES